MPRRVVSRRDYTQARSVVGRIGPVVAGMRFWNDYGRLCFQTGMTRWHPDEGWQVRVVTIGRECTFRVTRGSEVAFEHRYKDPRATWWRKYDVSRTEFEEEFDDFFRWVGEMWSDEQAQKRVLFEGVWKSPEWFVKSA
jgi:hypothetical protein